MSARQSQSEMNNTGYLGAAVVLPAGSVYQKSALVQPRFGYLLFD
jgi:hypothetical protein